MNDVTLDHLESLNCPHCGMTFSGALPVAFSEITCDQCGKTSKVPGKFGQFLLYDRQGESVTSVVFDAFDPKLGRNVTLKILNYVLSKNPELVEAFKHEALAAAALNSIYVLKVYEFGIHNRQPFMVMEYIEGKFLHEVMQQENLSEYRILEMMDGIVQGLEDMHDRGIMHGDVMPRNILIHTDGSPRISDFGLARFSGQGNQEAQDQQWESWSSPYYMPPERILEEKEDFRGDFYSLGTTLFNLLTGQLPFFDLDESQVLKQKVEWEAPDPRNLNPEISQRMAELCNRLLQRNPQDRPENYQELREMLWQIKTRLPRPEKIIPEADLIPDYRQASARKKMKEPVAWFVFLVLMCILGAMLISLPDRASQKIPPDIITTPIPTRLPTAPPLPLPDPTPTPIPIPIATLVPRPTPTPLPASPLDFPGLQVFLQPENAQLPSQSSFQSSLAAWRNTLDDKIIFNQIQHSRQPRIDQIPGHPPILRFSGNSLQSALTPQQDLQFTLVTVLYPAPGEAAKQAQVFLGIDPKAEGSKKFIIRNDPKLSHSYIFETEKGAALLTLPLHARARPCVLGFRRSPDSDRAYLGENFADLSNAAPGMPETAADRFPGLQLGGLEQEALYYQGWIGVFLYFNRALSDREMEILASLLRQKYEEPF